MNIKYMQNLLSKFNEVKIIGKTAEIKGLVFHVMGIVRFGNSLRLLALQYDEDFVRRLEESEIAEINGMSEKPNTNRKLLRGDGRITPANALGTLGKIQIGNVQFDIEETKNTRCGIENCEITVALTEFLRLGWNPDGIDSYNIDNLFLTSSGLKGEFDSIPEFGETPVLQLTSRAEHTSQLVEQPVMLRVGAEYPEKLRFCSLQTGEEHWAVINRIYLCDMWADMQNNFDNPRLREQLSPIELEKLKTDFENRFIEICPKGMCFPVIEYECEDGITLQFYSREWLDAAPVSNRSSTAFLIKPDEKFGVSGLPLKAALIHEPMPENTTSIEAELFLYNKLEKYDDLII